LSHLSLSLAGRRLGEGAQEHCRGVAVDAAAAAVTAGAAEAQGEKDYVCQLVFELVLAAKGREDRGALKFRRRRLVLFGDGGHGRG